MNATYLAWLKQIQHTAQQTFEHIVAMLGEGGEALQKQVKSINHCAGELNKLHAKFSEGVNP